MRPVIKDVPQKEALNACSSAPFVDLRSFLTYLDLNGRLRRVTKPINKDWELACIARWSMESTPEQDAYAILFENVQNHSSPVVVNLYSTAERYAEALGIEPDRILEHWSHALEHPREARLIESGPAQEIVNLGPKADLLSIPAPVWTPGRDAGPFLSAANVITKDPETGIQNMAVYRMQIHDSGHAGLCFGSKMQHGAIHLRKYAALKKPMPIAAVIGVAPAVSFASAAKIAYGIDELSVAGALAGTRIDGVRGKTVDLLVPAYAELVIEGFVQPDTLRTEGPFGEYFGYVAPAEPAAVVEVTAITHRNSPVHHGFVQQMPPSDGHLVMEIGMLGPLWFNLTRKLGVKGLRDLAIARGCAGLSILVVKIDKAHLSESAHIGRLLAKFTSGLNFIYVVDEEIDIRDQDALNWAISSRVNAPDDVQFVKRFQVPPPAQGTYRADRDEPASATEGSSVVVVNATTKRVMPEISLPSAQFMNRALEHWTETGLPTITPRRRLKTLLKKHLD